MLKGFGVPLNPKPFGVRCCSQELNLGVGAYSRMIDNTEFWGIRYVQSVVAEGLQGSITISILDRVTILMSHNHGHKHDLP